MGRHCAEMVQVVGGDVRRKTEGNAPAQGGANDQECGGKCGSLAQNLQAQSMRRGAQILVNEEEDARLLDRCEAKKERMGKALAV